MKYLSSFWVKIAIAAFVFYFLIKSNKFSWEDIKLFSNGIPYLILAFVVITPGFLISTLRFQLLLASQKINIVYKQILSWVMIGSFFDLALPSATGGDVVKAGYLYKHVEKEFRFRAMMIVLIDRAIGMSGLVVLPMLVYVFFSSELKDLLYFNTFAIIAFSGSAFLLLGAYIAGLPCFYGNKTCERLMTRIPLGRYLYNLAGCFRDINLSKRALPLSVFFSLINQACSTLSLLCVIWASGASVSLVQAFFVLPLALITNLFGVMGGFGIGTAGMGFCMEYILGIPAGMSIALIAQTIAVSTKLLGMPFYLKGNRKNDTA